MKVETKTYTIPHGERIVRNWLSRLLTLILVVVGFVLAIEFREEQRVAAEAQANLLKASLRAELIVQSSPFAHITCDQDGVIILCNPAAELLLGYEPGSLIGRNSAILVADPLHRKMHDLGMDRAVKEIRAHRDNYLLTRRNMPMRALKGDGTTVDVIATIRVIKYSDTVEFVVTLRAAKPEDEVVVPRAQPLPELPLQKELDSVQQRAR